MWQEIRMLREKFSILKLENDKLKEQLTWRPVSEKPEKGQVVLPAIRIATVSVGVRAVYIRHIRG